MVARGAFRWPDDMVDEIFEYADDLGLPGFNRTSLLLALACRPALPILRERRQVPTPETLSEALLEAARREEVRRHEVEADPEYQRKMDELAEEERRRQAS